MKFGLMAQRYKDNISLKLYRVNFQSRKQKKAIHGKRENDFIPFVQKFN